MLTTSQLLDGLPDNAQGLIEPIHLRQLVDNTLTTPDDVTIPASLPLFVGHFDPQYAAQSGVQLVLALSNDLPAPEVDFIAYGQRLAVFGHDVYIGRSLFYCDSAGMGIYFWDNSNPEEFPGYGIALGPDPAAFDANHLFVTDTAVSIRNVPFVFPVFDSAPSAPALGTVYFDSASDELYLYTSTGYRKVQTLPIP